VVPGDVYPPAQFPRHTLRNQTGVRAMHIVNSAPGEWEGANLYETPRREVRMFVMGRVEKPQEPAPPLPAPAKSRTAAAAQERKSLSYHADVSSAALVPGSPVAPAPPSIISST
jgi:hypothetical protein